MKNGCRCGLCEEAIKSGCPCGLCSKKYEGVRKFAELINFVFVVHAERAKSPKKATRKWDGKTPYGIHPIWCAMALLHETKIPEKQRRAGAEALLLHDILEDTAAGLPTGISDEVRLLVQDMTYGSTEEEIKLVWSRSPFIRLLKLYDKASNLMDGAWMSDEQRKKYAKYTKKLADDAKENFGELNIVKIAYALTE